MKNILLTLFLVACSGCLTAQKLAPLKNGVQTTGNITGLDYDSATSTLYMAGQFDMIDSLPANNIAAWDGAHLNTFAGGIPGAVLAVKEMNGMVYAGGYFQTINGVTVNNVASWDGTQWNAMANGINGNDEVEYLAAYNNQLWAAGYINTNADTTVNSIAVWNGSAWAFPNPGLNFVQVSGLKVLNNLLYIFGQVRLPGLSNTVGGAAVYNGSNWQQLPYDTTGYVIMDLGLMNDTLTAATGNGMQQFVNGRWHSINTLNVNRLFNYNGHLCTVYTNNFVNHQQFYPIVNDSLGQSFGNIYTGNGDYTVNVIATLGNKLFAGGNFYLNLNANCAGILLFNGSTWSNPTFVAGSSYIDAWHYASIYTSAYDSTTGYLYVGGHFLFAGNNFSPNVGYWDGQNWHAMGKGLNDDVVQMLIYNGSIYACGYFTASGTDSMLSIARWDGAAWQPVAHPDGYIVTMYVLNGDLYIGGNFANINNVSMINVARFNGTNWQPVGGNMLTTDGVSLLSSWQGNLVATNQSGFTFNFPNIYNIITLQGGTWQNMGNDIGSPINFYNYGANFYALSNADIYTYSNNNWALYSVIYNSNLSPGGVSLLTNLNGQLIASFNSFYYGTYTVVPDTATFLWSLSTTGIYKVDTSSYYLAGYFPYLTFGSQQVTFNNTGLLTLAPPNISLTVNADTVCNYGYAHYAAISTDLTGTVQWYMPGGFPDTSTQFFPVSQYTAPGTYYAWAVITNAYGTDTAYLPDSIVVDTCTIVVQGIKQIEQADLRVFPNPANNQVWVQTGNQPVLQIQLFDLNANRLMELSGTQTSQQSFSVTGLAAGMYYVTVLTPQGRLVQKLVIQ